MELTNAGPNEVNVPLTDMTAITLDPETQCEMSAILTCASFGTRSHPIFSLTDTLGVIYETKGPVSTAVAKKVTCQSNGAWKHANSGDSEGDLSGYRCFYNSLTG